MGRQRNPEIVTRNLVTRNRTAVNQLKPLGRKSHIKPERSEGFKYDIFTLEALTSTYMKLVILEKNYGGGFDLRF